MKLTKEILKALWVLALMSTGITLVVMCWGAGIETLTPHLDDSLGSRMITVFMVLGLPVWLAHVWWWVTFRWVGKSELEKRLESVEKALQAWTKGG